MIVTMVANVYFSEIFNGIIYFRLILGSSMDIKLQQQLRTINTFVVSVNICSAVEL